MSGFFSVMLIAAAVLLRIDPAFSQNYPSRSLTIVVTFPPGGNADTVARLLAARLTESLGQTIIVDGGATAGSTWW